MHDRHPIEGGGELCGVAWNVEASQGSREVTETERLDKIGDRRPSRTAQRLFVRRSQGQDDHRITGATRENLPQRLTALGL